MLCTASLAAWFQAGQLARCKGRVLAIRNDFIPARVAKLNNLDQDCGAWQRQNHGYVLRPKHMGTHGAEGCSGHWRTRCTRSIFCL